MKQIASEWRNDVKAAWVMKKSTGIAREKHPPNSAQRLRMIGVSKHAR
jgi:hypothetical protein